MKNLFKISFLGAFLAIYLMPLAQAFTDDEIQKIRSCFSDYYLQQLVDPNSSAEVNLAKQLEKEYGKECKALNDYILDFDKIFNAYSTDRLQSLAAAMLLTYTMYGDSTLPLPVSTIPFDPLNPTFAASLSGLYSQEITNKEHITKANGMLKALGYNVSSTSVTKNIPDEKAVLAFNVNLYKQIPYYQVSNAAYVLNVKTYIYLYYCVRTKDKRCYAK